MRAMEALENLRRQLAYDDWANRGTLASLAISGRPPMKALEVLAHLLGAESLWYGRIRAADEPAEVWPRLDPDGCGARIDELKRHWIVLLDELTFEGLSRSVDYTNSLGEPWTSTVGDILQHVVLHSAYHRGQIAAELRRNGSEPAYTDFIHGVRRGFV